MVNIDYLGKRICVIFRSKRKILNKNEFSREIGVTSNYAYCYIVYTFQLKFKALHFGHSRYSPFKLLTLQRLHVP